jgi:hypothetical protein
VNISVPKGAALASALAVLPPLPRALNMFPADVKAATGLPPI